MGNIVSQKRLAAILAADVVGYTRLIEQDTEATVDAWKALRSDIIDPLIARHAGRIVKFTGDGFLVEFPTVLAAVECAVAIQHGISGNRLEFRMGVNLGDILDDGDDIHGEGVNIAARIEALAQPGCICISAAVYEQIRNRMNHAFLDMGEHSVKHVSAPVKVFQMSGEDKKKPAFADIDVGPPVPAADQPSIAVLPFDNMSSDPEQEYFADGITEDIITEISKVPNTLVIARNSTFRYKGQANDIQAICRDLGVRYIVEGSVRKAGNRMRITAQLIDGTTGGHKWAERYDRELDDIFAVQDDVTEKIVKALELTLTENNLTNESLPDSGNAEAYDCVLRAREQYRRYTPEANSRAQVLYRRAVELDPGYAIAYSGLAMTCLHRWMNGSGEELDRAYDLVKKARQLGPRLSPVCEALSSVLLFRRQHQEALSVNQRWLDIAPGSAEGWAHMGALLHFVGRANEVIPLVEKAISLNPYYPFYYPLYMGQASLLIHRFEDAIAYFKRSIVLNPDTFHPYIWLAACYGHQEDEAEGQQAVNRLLEGHPAFSIDWLDTFVPYKRSQDRQLLLTGLRKAGLETA